MLQEDICSKMAEYPEKCSLTLVAECLFVLPIFKDALFVLLLWMLVVFKAAHVGVGISGLEGLQAACVSDYAIGQVRQSLDF